MKIFEVDTSIGPTISTPSPAELSGLVQFLDGRATDENAKKEISKNAFIQIANDLDINVTPENIMDIVAQPPLSNLLEPVDPNSDVLTFKGAGTPDVSMPVNKAQDIVAGAAKSAMNKDRGV